MTCGIYKIKNIGDEKVYIGHSLNIEYRWRKHVEALKAKRHENIHLQRAWDKHGKDNFIFEKIEVCRENELKDREQYWMDYYKCYNHDKGYNICPTADQTILAEETKHKMSLMAKKRLENPENHGRAILNWEKVKEIRRLYCEEGRMSSELAKMFNVVKQVITHVIHNKAWIDQKYKVEFTQKALIKRSGFLSERVKLAVLEGRIIPPKKREGEEAFGAKLTWEKVKELRLDYANGMSYKNIQQKYGISEITVTTIAFYRTWKKEEGMPYKKEEIPEVLKIRKQNVRGQFGEKGPNAKLTNKQAEEIRELYRIQKNSKNEISQKYGVSIGTVSNIVRNVVYKQNLSEIPVN